MRLHLVLIAMLGASACRSGEPAPPSSSAPAPSSSARLVPASPSQPARGNALPPGARISRIVLAKGRGRVVLQRDGETFRLEGDGACGPAPRKVQRLLDNLELLDLEPAKNQAEDGGEASGLTVEVYEAERMLLGFVVVDVLPLGYSVRLAGGKLGQLQRFNPALYEPDVDDWCSNENGAEQQPAGRILNERPELVIAPAGAAWITRLRSSLRDPESPAACGSARAAKAPALPGLAAQAPAVSALGGAERCKHENGEALRALTQCPAVLSVRARLVGQGADRVVELDAKEAASLPDGRVLFRDLALSVRGAEALADATSLPLVGTCLGSGLPRAAVRPSELAETAWFDESAGADAAASVEGRFDYAFVLSPLPQEPCGKDPRVPYLGGRILSWRFVPPSGKSSPWVSAARWKPPQTCEGASRALTMTKRR